MRTQWQTISQEQEDRFFRYSKRKGLVGKIISLSNVFALFQKKMWQEQIEQWIFFKETTMKTLKCCTIC